MACCFEAFKDFPLSDLTKKKLLLPPSLQTRVDSPDDFYAHTFLLPSSSSAVKTKLKVRTALLFLGYYYSSLPACAARRRYLTRAFMYLSLSLALTFCVFLLAQFISEKIKSLEIICNSVCRSLEVIELAQKSETHFFYSQETFFLFPLCDLSLSERIFIFLNEARSHFDI